MHLETSSVFSRLQCCIRMYNVLQERQIQSPGTSTACYGGEAARHLPVSDVTTAGEVEMLQALEVGRGLGQPPVGDARTMAERQAGEAAASPSDGRQADVTELW